MKRRFKVFLPLAFMFVVGVLVVRYFAHHSVDVLSPAGPVAHKERQLLFTGLLLSAVVVIPVFSLLFFFAWKYKESNHSAHYTPEWDHDRVIETAWWIIPSILILVISIITWNSSYALDPYKQLASSNPSMTIKVVALDWKWLFLYPDQHIATVNFVQFPINTSVNFEITADAPMNSFWIPKLGGQMYAMPGMSTDLHLLASTPGDFRGSSANISGKGFSNMAFMARATSDADFHDWLQTVHSSADSLSMADYMQLAQPGESTMRSYAAAPPELYDTILHKYMAMDHMVGM